VQLSGARPRYRGVNRWAAACLLPALLAGLQPVTALADQPPYRTVIETLVPKTAGVEVAGTTGGCDFLLKNTSGQDVVFFDLTSKPFRFVAPKAGTPPASLPVHLAGSWPCAALPAISEDQRWNHTSVNLLGWSVKGQVGSLAFKLLAHTEYDPALDPSSEWMFYLRIAAGLIALGGLLVMAPFLYLRRRQILAPAR